MKKRSFVDNRYLIKSLILLGVGSFVTSFQAVASTKRLQGYVMHIQMAPAICSIDKSKIKQRKCLEGYSLTITGLFPDTSQRDCTTLSSAKLSPIQTKVVARVMPDESARMELWRSIGGCVPMSTSQYFRNIINKAQELKIPEDLTGVENKTIQQMTLKNQFYRLNPKLQKDSIQFSCMNSSRGKAVLTNIQVCYKVNGQYRQCGNSQASNCPNNFMIQGSY